MKSTKINRKELEKIRDSPRVSALDLTPLLAKFLLSLDDSLNVIKYKTEMIKASRKELRASLKKLRKVLEEKGIKTKK